MAKRVLRAIKKQPSANHKELSGLLQTSEATIKRAIKELKNKNLIRRIGSDKSGSWEVLSPQG
jgi:predicted HTH transcriptional regulator